MRKKTARAGRKERRQPGYYDYNLLAVVIILICFGLVMLYSASAYEAATSTIIQDDMYYFRRQALISLGAILAAVLISRIDYHIFLKLSPYLFAVSLLLMALVKFSGGGVTAGGARRWLNIGGVQFQPSEVAKIAVILFMTYMILKMGRRVSSRKGVLFLLLLGGIQAAAAFFFTENLSTALIILGISCVMIFLAHPKTAPFLAALAVIGLVVGVVLFYLAQTMDSSSNFRLQRVLVWLDPEKYSANGGYQVLQGLYAIGSGGFFGKGLGNSTQKLSTIPEAQNDMIFSIICEELGLFGAIIVLLLFGYLLYRLFFIAQNAPDLYGTLIVSGIFAHIALQVVLNICVVLNVIPTTGVTLPFVSYGGTSVLFLMGEMGIALSVSRKIRFQDEEVPRKNSVTKNNENILTNDG
ncbi:MAG TPA: cell division protein FtsW [Candidatus Scatomonas merdavium]|nr:cell division protein FtsW [Candidatus Scatomonas merdavium]